jgi:ribosome-associated toxin RatA of RatAB toxin-antitoxin module
LTIERSVQLPYSQEQLFNLVNDIEQYPQFLPYCQEAKILRQNPGAITGKLRVGYKGLSYGLETQNTHTIPHQISMQLISGPFQKLEGKWDFHSLTDKTCQVKLQLNIVFKQALLGVLFKRKIDEITDLMVAAFIQRAKDLYT